MYESNPPSVTDHRATELPSLWQRWLYWLLPAPCLACRAPVWRPRDSLGLCDDCRPRLRRWPLGGCAICGVPIITPHRPPGYCCADCRRRPPPYDRLLAGWHYAPPLDATLLAFKFRRLDYLAGQLGRRLVGELGEVLQNDPRWGEVLVTAVPLHWRRRLGRGYDQARLVARVVAQGLALPYRDLLRRRRSTPPQSRAGRVQRRRNLRRAFVVRDPPSLADRHVLLVDDVVTTGATLEAAALCLRRAGAGRITALAVARTAAHADG